MMFPKRLTKRERLAAIMAEIDTSQIRELPEEAEASTTSEIGVAKSISITEDGRVLHGSTWTLPSDYSEAEVLDGALPSLKGCTPPTLPLLGGDQVDDPPKGVGG
jgi:hypothetical protein